MKTAFFPRTLGVLISIGSVALVQGQVVDVTASLDANTVPVGGSTTLRVFARVATAQQANADRIFSWYVDVINTNGTIATANYGAMQKLASDKDPSTSSTGIQDGANRRAIYDTFLNLPGAGVSALVELMAIPVSGLTAGQTWFRIQAGTGAGLSSDFLVAPLGGGSPLTGGNYSLAEALLTVNAGTGLPIVRVLISVTNVGSGAKGVSLTFPTIPGFDYTAQYRDQLSGGTGWQALPGAPHNAGTAFDVTSVVRRFYRVAIAPAGGSWGPAVKLSISVTNAAGGAKGITLGFPTTAGFNYAAQYRDQLSGGAGWQTLPGAPHNTGSAFQLSTSGTKFYRVAISPVN